MSSLYYLAQPYSGTHEEQNFRAAAALAALAHFTSQGRHVYSPIAHFHHAALAHKLPTDAATYRRHNFDILERCDGIIVLQLPGWKTSVGLAEELQYASDLTLEPCLFCVPPLYTLSYEEF